MGRVGTAVVGVGLVGLVVLVVAPSVVGGFWVVGPVCYKTHNELRVTFNTGYFAPIIIMSPSSHYYFHSTPGRH